MLGIADQHKDNCKYTYCKGGGDKYCCVRYTEICFNGRRTQGITVSKAIHHIVTGGKGIVKNRYGKTKDIMW
jgi:hypothetical protein